MRARFGLAGVVLLALCSAGIAAAEPSGSYGYLIPFGGYTIFDGDLRYPRAPIADGPLRITNETFECAPPHQRGDSRKKNYARSSDPDSPISSNCRRASVARLSIIRAQSSIA